MLQIDQKEIQVYSCTFRLSLKKLAIPLKVQGHYYIEWKLKTAKQGPKTSLISTVSNHKHQILIDQAIKLHTQLFRSVRLNRYYKRFTQLTVYLISSKNPVRPKIVGSMMIGLHQILNSNRYAMRQRQKLSFSPLDVSIEFLCQNIQCMQSSILETNLDSALLAQQNFVVNKQTPLLKLTKQLSKESFKQQNYVQDQETYSHGDCSFLQPENEQIAQYSDHKQKSRHQFVINNAYFISNSHIQTISSKDRQPAQSKSRESQSQWLVRQNKNLKKLLLIAKNQKSIETQRLQEELKELVRQLSIKQAQMLKLTECQESGSFRVGQLLDQSKTLNEKLEMSNRSCQILNERLNIQKQLNSQLDQNYRRLQNRLQLVKSWETQKSALLEQIKNLKQENQFLRLKNREFQSKLEQTQCTHLKQIGKYKSQIQNLQSQLVTNSSIIQLYEEKFTKFEQEIQFHQEEIVHRSQYRSTINETKQTLFVTKSKNQQKTKPTTSPINIEEEENALESINQEDLQQSMVSIKADKQIMTAAQLPAQEHFQTNFYRKMAKDVQQELNRLRILYQQKDLLIKKEKMTSKNLYQQLQRLRFQFVYELSKVTALLNQKIFEIRELNQQNFKLKAGKSVFLQHRIGQLNEEIYKLQEQKLEYFDKCYRLEEQNISLIHLSRQKDKILQLMLQSSQNDNAQGLVQNFERLLFILVNNPQKYQQTLKKYGLLQQSNLFFSSNSRHSISNQNDKSEYQLSQLRQPSNLVNQLDFSSNLIKSGELLLQSQARAASEKQDEAQSTKYLRNLIQQLIRLNQQRSNGTFCFKKKQSTEDSQQIYKKMKLIIQNIKKGLVRVEKPQLRQELLRLVKELEYYLVSHLIAR